MIKKYDSKKTMFINVAESAGLSGDLFSSKCYNSVNSLCTVRRKLPFCNENGLKPVTKVSLRG